MNKSFLAILREEDKAITNIRFCNETINEANIMGCEDFVSNYKKRLCESEK